MSFGATFDQDCALDAPAKASIQTADKHTPRMTEREGRFIEPILTGSLLTALKIRKKLRRTKESVSDGVKHHQILP